ncbi:MAG: hypothetical protein M3Z54_01570 [Gemmatimonadota bacterium]|nr:hypothetical protein [Gemmatimonadota bacterium]
MNNVFATVLAIVTSIGGAAFVVIALSGWLAKITANRIAQQDRARVDTEIEHVRTSLARDSATHFDALTRKREVYTRLAKALRVFVGGVAPSAEQKIAFLEAYDEACIWADESVVTTLEVLLDAVMHQPIDQQRTKTAYADCISSMRRDAGHPQTAISYRFVKF